MWESTILCSTIQSMANVFLSVVGHSDPDGNPRSEAALKPDNGPLLATLFDPRGGLVCEGIRFDRVWLLCCDVPGKSEMFDKANQVKGRIEELHAESGLEVPRCEILRLQCDPSDIENCLDAVQATLEGRLRTGDQVHIGMSSGSIGFQAAWYELTSWGILPGATCWRALNPLYVKGRRVVRQDTTRHLRQQYVERGLDSLSTDHLYDASVSFRAASLATPEAQGPSSLLMSLSNAAYALHVWDSGDWRAARQKLQAALRTRSFPTELRDHVILLLSLVPEGGRKDERLTNQGLMKSAYAVYGSLSRKFYQRDYENLATRARSCFERIVKSYHSAHGEALRRIGVDVFDREDSRPEKALWWANEVGNILSLAKDVYAHPSVAVGERITRKWTLPENVERTDVPLTAGFWSRLHELYFEPLCSDDRDGHERPVTFAELVNNSAELHFGRPPMEREQAQKILGHLRKVFAFVALGTENPESFSASEDTPYGHHSFRRLSQLAKSALRGAT